MSERNGLFNREISELRERVSRGTSGLPGLKMGLAGGSRVPPDLLSVFGEGTDMTRGGAGALRLQEMETGMGFGFSGLFGSGREMASRRDG